nr:hypothetical protein [Cryobacterium sp. TMT1-2-2]
MAERHRRIAGKEEHPNRPAKDGASPNHDRLDAGKGDVIPVKEPKNSAGGGRVESAFSDPSTGRRVF